MAHTVNFSMKDYPAIYRNVKGILHSDDLSFGNLEVPVANDLPMSTYPRFNVHESYLEAAISGGFDVFSLANNHSNDQGLTGIAGTLVSMSKHSSGIWFSGLRKTAGEAPCPVLIEKDGWKILFLSVTEILNSYDEAGGLVYYIAPDETTRKAFLADIARMRAENPCDLFVLSIHLNEPEYVRSVDPAIKLWFRELARSGIDIVWAHHPHVMQEWETAPASFGDHPALFMYSMGNFISGQRADPDWDHPSAFREYTGDGILLGVLLSRPAGQTGYRTLEAIPILCTNYTDPSEGVVVRLFDEGFISSLPVSRQTYFRKRLALMKAYLPLLPPVPVKDILE